MPEKKLNELLPIWLTFFIEPPWIIPDFLFIYYTFKFQWFKYVINNLKDIEIVLFQAR